MATFEVITQIGGGGSLDINGLSAAGALDGTEEVPVYQAGGNKKTTTQDIADLGGLGYLVYTALMAQSGTNPIVFTILQNTLGETPTSAYLDVGRFRLSGTFPANKTIVFVTMDGLDTQLAAFSDPGFVYINTMNIAGSYVNGYLTNSAIEIRVYP